MPAQDNAAGQLVAGAPLDAATRAFFEPRFGTQFDQVRVHTGPGAGESANEVGALAYTVGSHIVFGEGQYSPNTTSGKQLLAHELTHVVQQSGGDKAGSPVQHHTPARLARQPTGNPILTPEEMFEIIVRERAWTFNPGGAPIQDPAGVGRGVGPAAGGRRAGHAVFAVIQVTDRYGNPVALTYGEHLRYGAPHAEEGAINALRRTVPPGAELGGGRMTVVVDQVPCPPGRNDCLGLLAAYARQHGLELDIRLPTRERAGGGGSVAPRTATMSSQRTDMPAWRLEPYGPTGGGTPGSGIGGVPPPVAPRSQVPAASPDLVKARTEMFAKMQQQTARNVSFLNRLSTYKLVAGGLFQALDYIGAVSDALKIFAEGTLFPEAQRQADAVVEQAREAKTWAEETTDSISLLQAIVLIDDALERGDAELLADLDAYYGTLAAELRPPAEQFRDLSERIGAHAQAMKLMADFFKRAAGIPQGASTAPNAQQFALYQSLEPLSGRLSTAAEYYGEAAVQIGFFQEYLEDASYQANRGYWAVKFGEMAMAVNELERQRQAAASAQARIDLRLQIAENEARAAEPVSRPEEEWQAMWQERERLRQELAALGGS
jgi:hypothetical protein